MVSVAGLSKDPEVKRLAEKVMNLQMFDHIIGSKEQRYIKDLHTEGSHLMRISLVRISLLRFFKTFQTYLAYAFLGLFISLLLFLYVLG